jgi:hypothetical protein
MRPFLFFVLLVVPFSLAAQNRTNVWELSYDFTETSSKCELDYLNGNMDTISIVRPMPFFITDASICDTSGNLLFYSNGLYIENRNYDTLFNSIGFNPGWATDSYEPDGMGNCQGILILPDPGNSDRYYIFHESGEQFLSYNTYEVQPLQLSYSVVDMNLDNGFGGIIDSLKNQPAIIDTLLWGGLTAAKHANGRDWWIIAHSFYTDKYYKLLLTPDGVEGPYEQNIGSNLPYDVTVQATFSADGTKYCISNHGGWFDYMLFDRCTGEFSNPVTVVPDSGYIPYGCSFSPSSRFLYVSTLFDLYQYDTWDVDFVANVIHIAKWDSFVNPLFNIAVLFFMHQYAPDGKIYVSPFNGVEYLNVINYPDSLGLACNFAPHSYLLTSTGYTYNIPSFPNYDLGTLEDSPCDTIVTIPTGLQPPNSSSFRISPNPTTTWLNIVYETSADGLFELFDINGKRVAATSLYHYFKNRLIDVSNLPAGVYLATVTQNGKQVWNEKALIVH